MFYCDPSDPEKIKYFQQQGLPIIPAVRDVQGNTDKVRSLMAHDRLHINVSQDALLEELGIYHMSESGDKPVDEHNHACDAMSYGVATHHPLTVVEKKVYSDDVWKAVQKELDEKNSGGYSQEAFDAWSQDGW
jgi:hypothetical protein